MQIFTAQVKKSHYFTLFRNAVYRFTTYYILPLVQVGCGLVGVIRVIELVTMRKKKSETQLPLITRNRAILIGIRTLGKF